MSVVSSTDVECFRRLTNPEVVDVNGAGTTTRQIAQQMRQAMEQVVAAQQQQQQQQQQTEKHGGGDRSDSSDEESQAPREKARPPPAKAAAPASRLATAMLAAAQTQPPAPPAPSCASAAQPASLPVVPPAAPLRPTAAAPGREPPASPPPAEPEENNKDSDSSEDEQEKETAQDAESRRLEKQGFLIELQALQAKGVRLSRAFSMKDSLTELEFELQKQNSNLSSAAAVANLKDMMRIGFNGLEMANARFGPFLCMDGWAEAITSDMKRFDNSLEKLHKRYWRKQQMSPLMELGMIIVGSLVMHHFKTKLFGPVRPPAAATPRPAAAEAPPVAAPAAPRLRRGTPAQAQPHAGGSLLGRERAATAAAPATRPVLRPPTAVFGF